MSEQPQPNVGPATTAVVPAQKQALTIRGQLESPAFLDQVKKALPKHLTPERFIRVAVTAMNRVPKLRDCDQSSFFTSLLTLSQLGLEPDGRNAHLIPYENRKRGIVECQLIIDYKGLVELVMRSGLVSHIHADSVCENDVFDFDKGKVLAHKIDFRRPRGAAYAYFAICTFKDASEKCEVMTMDQVKAIQGRSRAGQSGPWQTDFDEMAKKTVFRRLSKWLPLSAEFRDAIEKDGDRLEEQRLEKAVTVSFAKAPVPAVEESLPVDAEPVCDNDGGGQ